MTSKPIDFIFCNCSQFEFLFRRCLLGYVQMVRWMIIFTVMYQWSITLFHDRNWLTMVGGSFFQLSGHFIWILQLTNTLICGSISNINPWLTPKGHFILVLRVCVHTHTHTIHCASYYWHVICNKTDRGSNNPIIKGFGLTTIIETNFPSFPLRSTLIAISAANRVGTEQKQGTTWNLWSARHACLDLYQSADHKVNYGTQ